MANICILLLLVCSIYKSKASFPANYFYLREEHTFSDARQRCEDLGYTGLAVIDSQEKEDQAKTAIQLATGGDVDVWMGLSYDTSTAQFDWTGGCPMGWSDWSEGEPNEMENGHKCIRFKVNDQFTWGTRSCDHVLHLLCEIKDPCSGSSYFVFHAKNVDSADQSLTSFHDVRSRLECSSLCLGHCCAYFLYDSATCVLFRATLHLDVSIPRSGAVMYRKIADVTDDCL